MARKVLIDCDPGIDDAVALCLALLSPELDVVAVTATAGNVPARQANRNVQTIIDQLDPPRFPVFGAATPNETPRAMTRCHLHGDDGLGGAGFGGADLHEPRPADKVICDAVREHPDQLTILSLGPLTNIARAFQRDRDLPSLVGRLVISGGSVNGIGNETAAAEFNMFYDPSSAQAVFRAPMTKTLVPLDVATQVRFTLDFVDALPPPSSRAGALLRKVVPFAFRAYRQELGMEGIYLHDVIALMAVLHPELFEAEELAGDVETGGELTTGATVFDRRRNRDTHGNIEVAMDVDVAAVQDGILRSLDAAGRAT